MKCDCGYNAFYYQWFYEGKRYDVYKCGYAMIESKKRTKCDLIVCNYISDIKNKEISSTVSQKTVNVNVNVNVSVNVNVNAEKTYKDELIRYIHLGQITQNFSKKYRANYIANINFLLNKLNFKLYFEETETLESLKSRITEKCIAKPQPKNNLPIKLVEYPDYLGLTEEVKSKSKNPKKKKPSVKITKLLINEDEEETKQSEEKQTDVLLSDSDSEEEEDNTFDVDNYDSGDDCEDFDDGGAFSD